ncbi:hypothetical protein BDV93DRAFT_524062 [Ceratobasidium sp. AG-I]|nr:hypothetical protein BDV93DRAFT_524062 [Ceratobasidium sp. AG-I]
MGATVSSASINPAYTYELDTKTEYQYKQKLRLYRITMSSIDIVLTFALSLGLNFVVGKCLVWHGLHALGT